MEVTYYGHSCFLLKFGGKQLFLDPFIPTNELVKNVEDGDIMPDFNLLTHAHVDHVADVKGMNQNSKPQLIFKS